MSATICEEPAVRDALVPLTVEAYQLLGSAGLIPERVELLEGILVEKMSKLPLHSRITLKLMARLLPAAERAGKHVRPEQPLSHLNSEPEPDLAVVQGGIDDYSNAHPATAELVVEVAVSSGAIDRRKRAIYAGAGVLEYWIVLPEERRVEVYRGPRGRDYLERETLADPTAVLTPVALPGFRMTMAELFPED